MISNTAKLLAAVPKLFTSLVNNFKEMDWGSIGKNIIDGIWSGIQAGWDWLTGNVKNLATNLFNAAKDALGIHQHRSSKLLHHFLCQSLRLPGRQFSLTSSLYIFISIQILFCFLHDHHIISCKSLGQPFFCHPDPGAEHLSQHHYPQNSCSHNRCQKFLTQTSSPLFKRFPNFLLFIQTIKNPSPGDSDAVRHLFSTEMDFFRLV